MRLDARAMGHGSPAGIRLFSLLGVRFTAHGERFTATVGELDTTNHGSRSCSSEGITGAREGLISLRGRVRAPVTAGPIISLK